MGEGAGERVRSGEALRVALALALAEELRRGGEEGARVARALGEGVVAVVALGGVEREGEGALGVAGAVGVGQAEGEVLAGALSVVEGVGVDSAAVAVGARLREAELLPYGGEGEGRALALADAQALSEEVGGGLVEALGEALARALVEAAGEAEGEREC